MTGPKGSYHCCLLWPKDVRARGSVPVGRMSHIDAAEIGNALGMFAALWGLAFREQADADL